MMDIETSAKAMFAALHARFDRMRDWNSHPDADSGAGELGRDTFRAMAVAAQASVPENPGEADAAAALAQGNQMLGATVSVPLMTDQFPPVTEETGGNG